jgi:hypothetical protein
LEKTLTNQNTIQEEIKSILKSGNACYLLMQNLLSPSLLSKNLKIKICEIIILTVVLYAVAQLVEALRYKPEGRRIDSRWCHWNLSLA